MRRGLPLLVVVAMVAAGCAGDASEDGSRSLRVQVSGEPEETKVYRTVVAAFERQHEDIDVTLVEVPEKDEHLAKLATSFAGGDAPEVFLINYREYAQFVVRDAIEPFQGFLESNDVDLDGYFPQPIEAFTYQGVLQCMPQNVSSLVVYFNKDLFAAAGMSAPPRGWDWAGFREVAVALTQGDVHGLGIEPSIVRLAPFVWANGGEIVDDDADPSRFTLDQPASREALEYLVGLVREDRVVPSEADVAAQDLETRFVSGKLGMYLSSRRDTPVFREVQGLDWDVAPLPTGKQQAGILHSDAYCLAAGVDPEKQADAARFVAFATGEQGQTITALGGRTVPSLKAVARSGAFLDPTQPPAHSNVFLQGVASVRRTPVTPTWTEIEDIAEEILTRAFYEPGYTIQDAIDALETETEGLFEEGRAS